MNITGRIRVVVVAFAATARGSWSRVCANWICWHLWMEPYLWDCDNVGKLRSCA